VASIVQQAFLCGCGAPALFRRDRCRRCQRRERLSRERFGGLREQVLARDHGQCQCCGEPGLPVHHRRPGVHRLHRLVTLCLKCHARIHHTYRPRYGFTGLLRVLWRELHPGLAEQRALPLFPRLFPEEGERVESEQAALFEAA
jgi:hypothetical protein